VGGVWGVGGGWWGGEGGEGGWAEGAMFMPDEMYIACDVIILSGTAYDMPTTTTRDIGMGPAGYVGMGPARCMGRIPAGYV